MTTKKKIGIAAFAAVVATLIAGSIVLGVYFKSVGDYQNKIDGTVIGDIDITQLADGVYTGSYDVDFIAAEVKVTVESGVITDIVLVRHDNDRGKSAEAIVEKVLTGQSLNVGVVAGATNSSKTILKAIENALRSRAEPPG